MQNEKNNRYKYNSCKAVIGSVTWAMRAQKALAAEAVPCTVVKTEGEQGARGCVYGIVFACPYEANVKRILDSAKIGVREWKTEK